MRILVLVLGAMIAGPFQDAKSPPPANWQGLISQEVVALLPKPEEKPVGGTKLVFGAFTDAESWNAFVKGAAVKKLVAAETLQIDWKKQAILYVVLPVNSNQLSVEEWKPDGRTGRFVIHWSGIEPLYRGRYPAVLHTVDRAEAWPDDKVTKEAREALEKKIAALLPVLASEQAEERAKGVAALRQCALAAPAAAQLVLGDLIRATADVEARAQLQNAFDALKVRVQFILKRDRDEDLNLGEVDLSMR